jgi:hypothetical protein
MIIYSPCKKFSFTIDKGIYKLLMRFKEKVCKEDSEVWIACQGDTGSGKSLKMMWWAYVLTEKLIPIKHICFSIDEFVKAVIGANKGDVVIADEAISIFFSRSSMTKEGRLIAELSNQIRQKNLVIILCLPDVLNLDYIAQKKLNALVHVWENRSLVHGKPTTHKANIGVFVKHSEMPQTQMLINYLKGKRRNPLAKLQRPEPMFHEKGSPIGENYKKPWYPILEGEQAYKRKKESVLDKFDKTKQEDTDKIKLAKRIYYLRVDEVRKWKDIQQELKMPDSTIRTIFKRYEKEFRENALTLVNKGTTNQNPPTNIV